MRLKDILNEEEDKKLQELKMKLLDARSDKQRALIRHEIDQIFNVAKKRYYSSLNGLNEQAAAFAYN